MFSATNVLYRACLQHVLDKLLKHKKGKRCLSIREFLPEKDLSLALWDRLFYKFVFDTDCLEKNILYLFHASIEKPNCSSTGINMKHLVGYKHVWQYFIPRRIYQTVWHETFVSKTGGGQTFWPRVQKCQTQLMEIFKQFL